MEGSLRKVIGNELIQNPSLPISELVSYNFDEFYLEQIISPPLNKRFKTFFKSFLSLFRCERQS